MSLDDSRHQVPPIHSQPIQAVSSAPAIQAVKLFEVEVRAGEHFLVRPSWSSERPEHTTE